MKKVDILLAFTKVILVLLLILTAFQLFENRSTGWFAANKEVTGSGMSVSAKAPHLVDDPTIQVTVTRKGYGGAHLDQDGSAQAPGDRVIDITSAADSEVLFPDDLLTVTVNFSCTPSPDQDITLDFNLTAPAEGGDIPVKVFDSKTSTTKRYYLSTQMKIISAGIQRQADSNADGAVFEELPGNNAWTPGWSLTPYLSGSNQPWGAPEQLTVPGPIHLGTATLPASDTQQTYQLVLKIKFQEAAERNQAVLRGVPVQNPQSGQTEVIPSSFHRVINITEQMG